MSEFKIQKAEGSYKLEDMQKRASVASTADGLTLEGPNFKLGCLTACPDMLLFACEQLAKANERVKELVSCRDQFAKSAYITTLRNICNQLGEPMPNTELLGQQLELGV